jgi:four helix bundle protein
MNQAINKFRNRCYQLTIAILNLTELFPNKKMYQSLSDQLFRSISSIGANLIEAKSSSSRKEYIKFYEIALKSANESKYWLYIVKESKIVDDAVLDPIINETVEIANIIGKSIITLKKK